ncbi:M20 family metallo-hydrolase [Histidinibacterium lentulum]|uniref:Zn-dependent hydrolase n=1 Tax=Histidinibacterium lentulum TaxID=2480588 RepID=A0A3N2QSB9_9RHOB|nr:M20 family metallo-hydrolase [Histidinibacterium lentulum]ROT98059.1 Zn-dependent hydrolase [Histidinibacterium lentulum]
MTDAGAEAARRLDLLSQASEPGPGVTRLPFTPEHRAALDLLSGWMEEAGLAVTLDDAGTLVGRLEGPAGASTLYMGSHQDSVREGGAFDGIAGIVLPLLALERLSARGIRLLFAVELLAFADEEGVRFPTALLGSRALAGTANAAALDLADRDGVTVEAALRGFGLNPDRIPLIAQQRASALGFIETHIEQGPVLERAGEALGIVTAISGIERHAITLSGETGHAGTLPMEGRRDALVGAAELVLAVRRIAAQRAGLRGTVGALEVHPGVVNAVPDRVRLTAEFRAPEDALREAAGEELHRVAGEIARSHGLRVEAARTYAQPAQPCDPHLSAALGEAVAATGGQGLRLPSGATHDASAMADFCPVAMLFVRCRDGVSHRPEEHAEPDDLGAAVAALETFLTRFDPSAP